MERTVRQTVIEIVEGDLTALAVEAIVNAANEQLRHGGGVAGAIVRRGGREIQEESDAWVREHGPLAVGEAAVTGAGSLPARLVIHTVGPRMGEGDEEAKLRRATVSCLALAEERGLRSLAFPAVSTGIFGFPLERCAAVMLAAARDHALGETRLERVVFCLFGKEACEVFTRALARLPD